MRKYSYMILLLAVALGGCLPKAGCTDNTAENYDVEAEENDGSCIPSRDKLVGDYTYTRHFTDVFTSVDSVTFGFMQMTESGTANNAFVLNMDGEYVLKGVITADDIVMDPYQQEEDFMGYTFIRTFNGTGLWLRNDTVDAHLTLTTKIPVIEGNPPALVEYTQVYDYYLTKQ